MASQPFQVLTTLLSHPGDVVSREYLREQIWNEGTFVDFEHGLNAAVTKLRRALNDSADTPRYIETVPGRGYRFIGALEHRLPAVAARPTPVQHASDPSEQWLTSIKEAVRAHVASIVVTAIAVAFGIWGVVSTLLSSRAPVSGPTVEFAVEQPPGTVFVPPIGRQSLAISPDGTRLAFTAAGPNGTYVWIRDLSSQDLWRVEGTKGASAVFWSPDSRSVLVSCKRIVTEANLETHSARTVATLPICAIYGAWRSNQQLFLYLAPRVFYELHIDTGNLRELQNAEMRWPEFLPGGDRFLHVVFDPASARYRAFAAEYGGKESTALMETDSRVQYAAPVRQGRPGHLLFLRGGSLLAQSFDAAGVRLEGEPFAIAQGVTSFRPSAAACFSVSQNGVLAYQTGFPLSELRWYSRAGQDLGVVAAPAPYVGTVRLSPDGQHVAAGVWTRETGGADIWVFGLNGRESKRLTYPPVVHSRPVWSPDGQLIAFSGSVTGPPRLATVNGAAGSKENPMSKDGSALPSYHIQAPTDWSRDGRFVAYDTSLAEEEQEVWVADTSTGKSIPILQSQFAQRGVAFSPDGRRIAFVSEESGRSEVYIQAFESVSTPRLTGERRQVSRNSAWIVRWRYDGRELFYLGTDNWLYAVTFQTPLTFSDPKPLFRVPGSGQYGTASDFQFDVTRDGQRFIMSTVGTVTPPAFTVVQNWIGKFNRAESRNRPMTTPSH